MPRNYSNIAADTTLAAGIGAGDTSITVASATGWPSAPFAAVLDPGAASEEVVQVTVKTGTTWTVTRGFDGTTAAVHALGVTVRHAAIAGDFTDLQAADTTNAGNLTTHAALTTSAHGGIVASNDSRLTDARTPTGAAGGVLGGTYPNPSFAADMATQAELDAEAGTRAAADTTNASAISTHAARTDNPHSVTAAQAGAYTTSQVDTLLAAKQASFSQLPHLIVAANGYSGYSNYQCDGTADQVQIQAAIDALGATGGVVQLTPGTYNVANAGSVSGDTLVTPYCVLIDASDGPIQIAGAGMDATTINLADSQAKNTIPILIRGASAGKRTALTTIANLTVTCANPATQTAWDDFGMIEVAYSDSVAIDRVKITNSPYIGAQIFRDSQKSIVCGCNITYGDYGNGLRVEVPGCLVANNTFNGDPADNFACLDLSCNADVGIQGERTLVEGNIFLGGRTLIGLGGHKGSSIVGNMLTGATHNSSAAIALNQYEAVANDYHAEYCLVANNMIVGCRQGITIGGGATWGVRYTTIANNTIVETGAVALAFGIIEASAAGTINNLIVGNRIYGAGTGISAPGAPANGTLIRDNLVDTTFGGHTHAQADVTSLVSALAAKEPSLGNPASDGYVLSSTAAGVRSWVAGGSGAPAGAQYLTLAIDAGLSAERVLAVDASLLLTDGGANGNATLRQTPKSRRVMIADEDFVYGQGNVASRVGGAGAGVTTDSTSNAADSAGRIGWLICTTGTTTTGRASGGHFANTAASIVLGVGALTYETVVKVVDLSDGTETYTIRLGLNDAAGSDGSDAVMFRYAHSVNTGKFECVTRSNGVETATDSGHTLVAGTPVKLGFVVNAGGTSVAFSVNGSVVQTHTTNIPTTTTRATAMSNEIAKSAGITPRLMLLDYLEMFVDLTTPR